MGQVRCAGALSSGHDIPAVDVLGRRKHLLACGRLPVQEPLELEEVLGRYVVFQVGEPAVMQRLDLEAEQLLLLVRQAAEPLLLVELDLRLGGGRSGARGRGRGRLGAEKVEDVATRLGFFGLRARLGLGLALESRHRGLTPKRARRAEVEGDGRTKGLRDAG